MCNLTKKEEDFLDFFCEKSSACSKPRTSQKGVFWNVILENMFSSGFRDRNWNYILQKRTKNKYTFRRQTKCKNVFRDLHNCHDIVYWFLVSPQFGQWNLDETKVFNFAFHKKMFKDKKVNEMPSKSIHFCHKLKTDKSKYDFRRTELFNRRVRFQSITKYFQWPLSIWNRANCACFLASFETKLLPAADNELLRQHVLK